MAGTPEALILQLSADIRGLEKQMQRAVKTVDGGSKQMERRAKVANDNIGKAFAGGALKQGVDALASRAPAAVSSLNGIGAAGTVAAVGVGAVVAALNQAKAAVAFGDAISDAATKVGVSTDVLQEYRFAIHQLGGETADADDALAKFTQTLGKAQTIGGKSLKAFKALEIDPQQFHDADEALRAVLDQLARIPDESKRQGLATALGLEKFIPLAREGTAKLDELREAARSLGYVMDKDLIAKAGDANDKLEDLQQVVSVQVASAFVELAPVILKVAESMADGAKFANDFAATLADVKAWADNLGLSPLASWFDNLLDHLDPVALTLGAIQKSMRALQGAKPDLSDPNKFGAPDRTFTVGGAPFNPKAPGAGGSGSGRAPKVKTVRDSTDQRTAEVEGALNDAERDLLQAWNSLILGADQRADISKQILDVEKEMLNDRIKRQQADIRADEGLSQAKKDELIANLEIVRTEQGKVDELKRELIDRELAADKARDAADLINAEIDSRQENVQSLIGLAKSAAERRVLEYKLLDLAEQRAQAELDVIAATKGTASVEYQIAQKKLGDLQSNRGIREETARQQTMGPVEAFIDANQGAERFRETLEDIGVHGFENLADALAQAVVSAEDLGEVATNVFRQIAAEALAAIYKKAGADIGAAILSAIPGYATGTNSAPGGLAWVGERGKELVNLPKGSQVIPNNALGGLTKARAAAAPGAITFDLRGAVVTEDLLAQMNSIARREGQRGRFQAIGDVARGAPGRQRAFERLEG